MSGAAGEGGAPRLKTLGEFGLIERVRRVLQTPAGAVTGIGDDCAVLRVGERTLLATCDAAFEDVHFCRAYASAEDIGWKCGAAALSDIAAMGGRPLFLLVALGCPEDAEVEFVDGLYRGLSAVTGACGGGIVGGDTTRSPAGYVIDVTVIGEPGGARWLLRSGARAGGVLAVTGWPGCSGAGLEALQSGLDAPVLRAAHLHPMPRIAEGQWLAAQAGAHALIDVSDGLVQDAGHLAECSGLAVDIEREAVPIEGALAAAAPRLGRSAAEFALSGGEDYELLVALDAREAAGICAAFRAQFDLPLTPIGRFAAGAPRVTIDGAAAQRGGFDHFRA